jgi:hypothetical protein
MRINQDITDISSEDQLLRYAVAGQLAQLLDERMFLDQGSVAQGAGFAKSKRMAGQVLSRALNVSLTPKQLIGLDEVIGALGGNLDSTSALTSLALRLSMEQGNRIDVSHLIAHVPPRWTSRLLQDPPADEIGALTQASAILAAFQATHKMETSGQSEDFVRNRYSEDLKRLARRLVAIAGAPPTAAASDAQVLLGVLSRYSFDTLQVLLDRDLRYSPFGYRIWQAMTKLVTQGELRGRRVARLREWVRELLESSNELRNRSIYPGRALDIELAIAVPASWSPPGDQDYVSRVLLQRAMNQYATIEERGSAALGLWERSVLVGDQATLGQVKTDLRALILGFRQTPGERPDCPGGLPWIASTLEHLIETGQPVSNDWPMVDDSWYQPVQQAAHSLDNRGIPTYLLTGTRNLFLHMILQNAGRYRSLAIETVVTSGWGAPVARALGYLLETEPEAWVRIRAEAALGLLRRPHDPTTQESLTRACLRASENLNVGHTSREERGSSDVDPMPRARVSELHAALFAVGDCFGVPGAEAQANTVREALRDVLSELAKPGLPQALVLRRPARAAAYLLTATAQASLDSRSDLSRELLEQLRQHPDQVTSRFSDWALRFRFAPDGSVRPFMAAAEQPLDETPSLLLDAAEGPLT